MTSHDDPEATAASILWERLDEPGHDACRLTRRGWGWHLSGTAVPTSGSPGTFVHYEVTCDSGWRTIDGVVVDYSPSHVDTARFRRTSGGLWAMNGVATDSLADCVDLDFGFTPATNILQLQRLSLRVGERADVPVAWFDRGADALQRLPQVYHRLSEFLYAYHAPTIPYSAELEVNAFGFIGLYPGLWRQVA